MLSRNIGLLAATDTRYLLIRRRTPKRWNFRRQDISREQESELLTSAHLRVMFQNSRARKGANRIGPVTTFKTRLQFAIPCWISSWRNRTLATKLHHEELARFVGWIR
jgi:hypothetical protein